MSIIMDSCEANKYKCPENGCTASYTKLFKLEIHKRKHTGEKPFVCDIEDCTKAYTNIAHLKRHKSFAHDKSSEVMCTVSGCGQVFNNKYSLKKHSNQQHNVNNNMFKCAHCLQEFKKKRQLKIHLLLHTGGEEALKCSVCNVSFGSVHLYNKHKSNHKTYTCDCGSIFNRWTLFCKHRKTSCSIKKIDHKCIICNKVFTTKTNLKVHSLSHLEESQKDMYHCPYLDCKRSYKYKKNLTSHISVYHEKKNDDSKINCTEEGCDMVFKSKKNLRQHILNIHKESPKKKKDRKPRKDKGKKKKCMASILSGVPLPLKEHLAIMTNSTSKSSKDNENLPKSISPNVLNGEKPRKEHVEEILIPASDGSNNKIVEEANNLCSTKEDLQVSEKNLKQNYVEILWNIESPLIDSSFTDNDPNLKNIPVLEEAIHYL